MTHNLILELLEPFMELHMILVCTGIIVLAPSCLAPVSLCQLEGVVDFAVKDAVPLRGLAVEFDAEDAGLDTQLEDSAAVVIGRAQDTLLALVAARGTTGDVSQLGPR
jgi:hypothetical protein